MTFKNASEMVQSASKWSILWGICLVALGILAIGSPLVAAVAVTAVIAWLIVFAGVVHMVSAFRDHRGGSLVWRLLVGLAYIFFGMYVVVHPALGVASLTLVLAFLFAVEGLMDIGLYFRVRPAKGSGWVLMDGIVTLLLGVLIYAHWPSSTLWAIGTLVGVSLIMSGVTRVMLSLAVKRVAKTLEGRTSAAA